MRNPLAQERASALRRQPTDAERHLWYHLRRRHLGGYRFRRQAPVGPYIVDFLCIEAAVVVEVDGGQHARSFAYDEQREQFLASRGLRLVRFWNNEILQQTDAVLDAILGELKRPPS